MANAKSTSPYQRSAPKLDKTNYILTLSKLFAYRQKNGFNDLSFAAGLPGHKIPQSVQTAIASVAKQASSAYPDYDPKAPITSKILQPKIAAFHQFHFGGEVAAEETGFAPGSTAILQALAAITGNYNKTAILPHPGYPLMQEPLRNALSHISLYAAIKPNETTKRWELSKEQLAAALEYHREENSFLYFNFPSNPTGYSPTAEEYQEIVRILMKEIKIRQERKLPPPCILEDQAYAMMMHDGRRFYSIFNAINDMRQKIAAQDKSKENNKQLELLDIIEKCVVVAHSFSKTFAAAGDRVAYWVCKNPEMQKSISTTINSSQLTPSRSSLAVANAILEEKQYDTEAMREYGHRLRHLENSLNSIFLSAKKTNRTLALIPDSPIKAKADAGFFATADFSFLQNMPIAKEKVAELRKQLSSCGYEQENEIIFQNDRINNSFDASLWLLATSSLLVIPITASKHNPNQIYLRFSVGCASKEEIDQAMGKLEKTLLTEIQPKTQTLSRL
jgi:aspartate/methionine/tyrosine aminotransferase